MEKAFVDEWFCDMGMCMFGEERGERVGDKGVSSMIWWGDCGGKEGKGEDRSGLECSELVG